MIDCNEWRTEKRQECANMGKVKWLELWWQLCRTSFPVWDLENFRPMDFCWHECTLYIPCDMVKSVTHVTQIVTANLRVTQHRGAFVYPLLLRKSKEHYTTWVCVFVALGIQHAMRVRHIVTFGPSRSTNYFHIISPTALISKKRKRKRIIEHKFVWHKSKSDFT